MLAHKIDSNGLILNTIVIDSIADRPDLIDASIGGQRGDSVIDGVLVIAPVVVVVPFTITMRQLRLHLFDNGHMPAIVSWVNGLSANQKARAQIEWDFDTGVRRDKGIFVQRIAPVLNMSEQDIDDLFIAAAQL